MRPYTPFAIVRNLKVPSERAFHGAARFNDSTMLIYGGFSHRCEEYCDDVWSFDLRCEVTSVEPMCKQTDSCPFFALEHSP